jgi:hypothetical protein
MLGGDDGSVKRRGAHALSSGPRSSIYPAFFLIMTVRS